MFERFTERARKVVVLVQEEAQGLSQQPKCLGHPSPYATAARPPATFRR